MHSRSLSILLILVAASSITAAQTTLSPDISVIPRFRLETNDGNSLPVKREFSDPEFSLEEFEIAMQAYLNPYARADVFITKSGTGSEPVELEEAYATFLRGLPLDLNARIGKYLVEFGKLNNSHPHAWPFLSKPLSQERFLGTEGINDMGASVSYILPTGDIYSRLTVDLFKGMSIGVIDPRTGVYSGGAGLIDTVSGKKYLATSARITSFFTLSDYSDLETGLSGLTGIHDPYNKYRFYYVNIDFKYKWKPDSYTSLTLQGEGLLNSRTVSKGVDPNGKNISGDISTSGLYIYGDYQFMKIFSAGMRLDWSQSPYSKDDRAYGAAVFLGYYPVEETTAFRIEYNIVRSETPASTARNVNTVALQFMFSMGPHKAHPF